MRSISDLTHSRTLLLGTNNRKKMGELVNLLEPRGFVLKTPSDFPDAFDVDETGSTFLENARLKAIAQATRRGLWAIGEDSGLCVSALHGAPGIYSARFSGNNASDESNNALLIDTMRSVPIGERQAYYVSTIVLADPEGGIHIEVQDECWGRILSEPRGIGGFGYDPLFEVPEYQKTFAELGIEVKQQISRRARALRQFLEKLDSRIGGK